MSLQLINVSFSYGVRSRRVLDDFSFEFADGSTLLLGPNGAGKSTMLGLAATTLRPRAGSVALDGLTAGGRRLREYRAALAWLPQDVQFIPGLTVRDQVAYVGWLKGLSKKDAWARSLGALERVSLDDLAGERPRRLSGGQARRLGIAQVLVHDASWLLMDEPSAGLDPVQRADFHALIAELRGEMNIVISTHQTEDINTTYDRVVVVDEGRVRFAGSAESFLALGNGRGTLPETVVDAYRRALAAA